MAPKLLKMGYSAKDILTAFNTASQLGLVPKELTPEQKLASDKVQIAKNEENAINKEKAFNSQTKATELNAIKSDEYLSGSVGPNWLSRLSPTSIFSGGKQNFIASVKQLTDQETMNTLLNLKQAGGTLGALSDSERQMLQDAASKINNWAIKDPETGAITGYNASEDDFKAELTKLHGLAQRATDKANGAIATDTPAQATNQNKQAQPTLEGMTQWIKSNPNNPKAKELAEMIQSGKITQNNIGSLYGQQASNNNQGGGSNERDPLGLGF
jgi:hypothetical protein